MTATSGSFRIERFGRYFAVYEDKRLVCVCLYRKGAAAVIQRILEAVSQKSD